MLSHTRRCFFKIAENADTALANCETHDRLMKEDPSGLLAMLELSRLCDNCNSEARVNYVKNHLRKYCFEKGKQ